MARKMRVLIDDEPEVRAKGMAPLVQSGGTRTLELATDVIRRNLIGRMQDLAEVLHNLPEDVGGFTPSEITVSFAVTGSGEVSLLTALKGGAGMTGTFTVKMARKPSK